MKVTIVEDEWYPVLTVSIGRVDRETVELPEELYEEYIKVLHRFRSVQDKLEPYFEQQRGV